MLEADNMTRSKKVAQNSEIPFFAMRVLLFGCEI